MNNRLNQTSSPNPKMSQAEAADTSLLRNAYNISILILVAAVPSISLFIYYGLVINAWQTLTIAAILSVASIGTVAALFLIPRGRSNLAMIIVISSFTIAFISIPFFVQGLGVVFALSIFILTVAVTGLAMPVRYARSGLALALASSLLVLLLDYLVLGTDRLKVPQLERTIPFIAIGFATFVIIFTFRQFNRFSLRIKVALSILLTGGIAVTTLAFFGINRAESIVKILTDRYEETSTKNIEQQILATTQNEANKADVFFAEVQNDLVVLANYRTSLESQSTIFNEGSYWNAQDHLIQLPDGQIGNSSTDIASIFIPSSIVVDENILKDLNTTAYLDFYAPNFLKSHPDVVAVYYISETGSTTYYPNISLAQNVPADFDATKQSFYTIATPERDLQREPRWTEVYQDPAGNGLITTLSVPVYVGDTFKGVMSADLQLEKIAKNIANIRVGKTGTAFLVDQAGHILAMPSQTYLIYEISPEKIPANASPKLSVLVKGPFELQEATARMINGETGIATILVNNANNYISFTPLATPNYRLAIIAPESEFTGELSASRSEIQQRIESAIQGIAIILISLLIGAIIVSFWVGQLITGPLARLTQTAENIAQGNFTARARVEAQDETGILATSFNSMAEKLNDTLLGLEKSVSDRTQELESANESIVRRAAQFESIAHVAHSISSTQTMSELLPQIADTISNQFGFYHVGIFLLDTHREYAVLVAANSEGGKRMLDRNHRLLVGGSGIVGFVTNAGRPRVALDVGLDAAFFNNPDLPDTHSEIALPLRIGTEVIGALDVQSREINAFSQEDVNILSTLADQVSIAIQNARSYQQSREALAQAEAASIHLSGQQWKQYFTTQPIEGFVFDGVDAKGITPSDKQRTHSLVIPLTLRGTRIGTLKLSASDPTRAWTEDEIAMAQATAERTALAVESARLLQEAQKRAAKERTIGDISAKIGGLVNIENILQTAIQELGNNMPNTDIAIQFKKEQETE